MEQKKKFNFGKWWREARPTKTATFWFWIGSIILTMIIGFTWGGWVTGGKAQKMADVVAKEAVVERLASICVAQFNQDPGKSLKLEEVKAVDSYKGREYVQVQGWATMPGETGSDRKVADECVKLLLLINP